MHTYTHTYVLYIIHTLQYQTLYVDDSNVQVAHYFGGDIYVVYVGMSISAPLASKLYPSSNGIESSTDKKNYPHKHFDASVATSIPIFIHWQTYYKIQTKLQLSSRNYPDVRYENLCEIANTNHKNK